MRICVLDIETTSLEAIGAGWVLCAVMKPLEGEHKIFRFDKLGCKLGHECELVRKIFESIAPYDLVIGHNLKNFDWLYLKSRALVECIPLPKPPMVYDTMRAARRVGIKTVPNIIGRPTVRLDHVIDFFGIPNLKTPIFPRVHWQTVWDKGKRAGQVAMNNLVAHCVSDVTMTEAIYWRLIEHDPRPEIIRVS